MAAADQTLDVRGVERDLSRPRDVVPNTLDRVLALLEDARRILIEKNARYSATEPFSNIKASRKIGVDPSVACFVRMTDKWSRLENLLAVEAKGEDNPPLQESVEDTILDLGIYAFILLALRKEEAAGSPGKVA